MDNLEQIAYSIITKVPYRKLLNLLKDLEIPTARGKENIIQKLIESFESGEITDHKKEILLNAYYEAIQFGDKAIKFFPLTDEDISQIESDIENLDLSQNEFAAAYPFLIPQSVLNDMDNAIHLCNVEIQSGVYTLTCVSKRFQKTKVELKARLEEYSEAMTNINLENYNEIFGYRMEHHQCFDYVIIDVPNRILQIHSDISNILIHSDSLRDNFQSIIRKIDSDFSFANLNFSRPHNLFNNIKRLYDDTSEGKVGELGFLTDTSSVKHSKMRRGNNDLREELFHVGGSEKLLTRSMGWTAFKIALVYTTVESGNIELFFPGNIRTLEPSNRRIDEVWIKGCSNSEDYADLMSKIQFD